MRLKARKKKRNVYRTSVPRSTIVFYLLISIFYSRAKLLGIVDEILDFSCERDFYLRIYFQALNGTYGTFNSFILLFSPILQAKVEVQSVEEEEVRTHSCWKIFITDIMPLIIDDYEPSAYEKKRIERIKKNEEHMKKLGLHKYQDFMKKKSPPKKEKKFPPIPKVKPGEERRSGRFVSKSKSELVMLDFAADDNEKIMSQDGADYDDDDNDDDDDNISYQTTKPRSKKIRGIDQEEWKLSEKERESLAGSVDENYLGKFQEFLEDHDGISEQNVRNVMRQVRKLASGAGIRYEVR